MQLIEKSSFQPPNTLLYRNAHLSTIIAGILKTYPTPHYKREKLELPDGDFLLLDWLEKKVKNKLIIISHGMEGHSRRTYVNSCADYFNQNGYSILAWNQRSCGGEMNRLPSLYHLGIIEDLQTVIRYAVSKGFSEIYLIGYSMGGTVSLNYLGKADIPEQVKACITFSTPMDLMKNAKAFKKPSNFIYLKNFMLDFKKKLKYKHLQFPRLFDKKKVEAIKSFDELDEYFTAPMFGFKSKEDYYQKSSPLHVLKNIKIPTLIVNAENDPFLTDENYLDQYSIPNPNLYFEKPKYGGHMGFSLKSNSFSWAEIRAKQFIDSININ